MSRYEITKTCSEIHDPWEVDGYKLETHNNFLNPNLFYQHGEQSFDFPKNTLIINLDNPFLQDGKSKKLD